MKKFFLFVAAITFVISATAGNKDKTVNLVGSWKEFKRFSLRSEPLDYTDTTFYDFMIGNEYTVQRKSSYMYRGTYKVASGQLDLGMRTYNIVEMSDDRMMLKDDAGSYQFIRYDKAAAMAENNTAADNSERAFREDLNGSSVSAKQLAGKWEVYKRTSSEKIPEVDYNKLIRVIEVKMDGNSIGGSVSSTKDIDGSPSWKIVRFSKGIIYCNGKNERQLKVLKCKNNELIVEEGITTYFFKQFK